ncbi:MAG: hypothetical protein GOP50_10185, partial [Candidatus Heimdallarchaeota archaeon]|nr:hypothetical protein [Candidatus Heimdallarchaeota archaeon]
MSILKTRVNISEVEGFLKKNFSTGIKNIEILKGGEISQAFSFDDNSASFVIKVRKVRRRFRKVDPFAKETEISKILRKKNPQIPIPKVVRYGLFKGDKRNRFIYSIVEKANGSFVHLFQKEKANLVDESLVDTLYLIHSIDVSKTKGYGFWERWNKAKLKSMQEHILKGLDREKIYTNDRFSSGIFEKDLYLQGSTRIKELINFCSSKRYLVHADYG